MSRVSIDVQTGETTVDDTFELPPEPIEVQIARITQEYEFAIQNHLDEAAQSHGYDNILSACSYAGFTNAYQAEGIAFGQWRAACWRYAYDQLAAIQAGTRTQPTVDELLAELPVAP
jgi:hypothetical protein